MRTGLDHVRSFDEARGFRFAPGADGSLVVSVPEFSALYEEYFDFVWRSLRRLGVREADVTDVAQGVFLTIHKRLPTFEGRSRLSTWIFGICLRGASDYRRSAPVRREIITASTRAEARWDGPDPLARAESHQGALLAELILNKLSEPQRVVFVLFELEEFSAEEIAEVLDIPVGTVRSRLRLARKTVGDEARRFDARQAAGLKEVV